MMDPKFSGEIKIFIVDANGNEHPINSVKSEDVQVKKEEPKTFPQSISDIVSEYEQMLIDWDMSRISDEEMEDRMAEFQLKSRPMILDMLDEIKTINHILGYIRTMLSSTRIAALYGDTDKTKKELSEILKEIDYLRSKMNFTKVEPIIGKSAGPDEIEEFLNDEEEIEIIELDDECDECDDCKECHCNECKDELSKVIFGKDGDMITAYRDDFINLAESNCGFGKDEIEALKDLLNQEKSQDAGDIGIVINFENLLLDEALISNMKINLLRSLLKK